MPLSPPLGEWSLALRWRGQGTRTYEWRAYAASSAVQDLRECQRLERDFVPAYEHTAELQAALGHYQQIWQTCEKGLAVDPRNEELRKWKRTAQAHGWTQRLVCTLTL